MQLSGISEKRLSIIALSLVVVAIVGSLALGRSTFNQMSREIENQILQHDYTRAQLLASLAEPVHGLPDSILLVHINEMWDNERNVANDDYICIVDASATLLLHSSAPQTVGNYAGANCLVSHESSHDSSTLGKLVESGEAYVGGYISSAGHKQIAAFSPMPSRGWVIGVHRSHELVHDLIATQLQSQFWSMLIISLGIIPISFGLLFLAFLRIHRGQKLVEQELIASEHANRAITQTAADAIITIDSKGQVLLWNEAAERIFGYSSSQMIGGDLARIIPDTVLDKHHSAMSNRFEHGADQILGKVLELSAQKANGEQLPVELSLSSWESGTETHYTGIVRDISERKQAETERHDLESQLRQAHKLEAIGTMAGGIAHDFNNILQAQFLYTGILERHLADDSKLKEYLHFVVDAGKRARDLVRQILTFSQQSEVEYEDLRIQEILADSLELIKSALPSMINLENEIDLNAAPVRGDEKQVQQIILNLCNNARQAIGENEGEITVSFAELQRQDFSDISKTNATTACGVGLTVKDNGCGMSPETLKNIFDPFFTTKEPDQGSGLGLAATYGIVKDMGGEIDVVSQLGKGSIFKIWLPTVDEEEVIDVEVAPSPNTRVLQSILFIDDEEAIRESAQAVLEKEGFRVVTDPSGSAALSRLQAGQETFDVIITDYTMPRMSGLELSKQAMTLFPDVTIIMMSGNVDKKLLDGCKQLGIKKVLQKPWTEESLLKYLYDK